MKKSPCFITIRGYGFVPHFPQKGVFHIHIDRAAEGGQKAGHTVQESAAHKIVPEKGKKRPAEQSNPICGPALPVIAFGSLPGKILSLGHVRAKILIGVVNKVAGQKSGSTFNLEY